VERVEDWNLRFEWVNLTFLQLFHCLWSFAENFTAAIILVLILFVIMPELQILIKIIRPRALRNLHQVQIETSALFRLIAALISALPILLPLKWLLAWWP
jgi:hypothetical protein